MIVFYIINIFYKKIKIKSLIRILYFLSLSSMNLIFIAIYFSINNLNEIMK